jgi:hypothetical protein
MRKNLLSALLVAGLAGCATSTPQPPQQYGNFVPSARFDQQKLGIDAAQKLATLYAPAQTRLELSQSTSDPFGAALVKSLRDKGFGVQEYVTTGAPAQDKAAAGNQVPTAPAATNPGTWPLRYVLDQAGGPDLYRVTLEVGGQIMTRAYLVQNGVLAPAGYWARKE